MAGDMNGRGSVLTLLFNGAKEDPLEVESWSVKPIVVAIADGVCGEDRQRLDREIEHYALQMTCLNSTARKLVRLLRYDASTDASALDDVTVGLKLTDKRRGVTLLQMSEIVIDDWEWAVGGRTERQKVTIPCRGRYLKTL